MSSSKSNNVTIRHMEQQLTGRGFNGFSDIPIEYTAKLFPGANVKGLKLVVRDSGIDIS